jgi:hypothetical protein
MPCFWLDIIGPGVCPFPPTWLEFHLLPFPEAKPKRLAHRRRRCLVTFGWRSKAATSYVWQQK